MLDGEIQPNELTVPMLPCVAPEDTLAEQLPTSKIVKAFANIQAPTLLRMARPAGDPDRIAPAVSSDYPEAVELVTRLYDQARRSFPPDPLGTTGGPGVRGSEAVDAPQVGRTAGRRLCWISARMSLIVSFSF